MPPHWHIRNVTKKIKCIIAYQDSAADLRLRWLLPLPALCLVRYGCRRRSSHESGYRAFHCSAHWKGSNRRPQNRIQGTAYHVSPSRKRTWHTLPHSKVHNGMLALRILVHIFYFFYRKGKFDIYVSIFFLNATKCLIPKKSQSDKSSVLKQYKPTTK